MHLWPRHIADGFTDGPRKIWRVIEKFGAKFKIYRWIFNTSPTEKIKIIINFISVDESIGKTGI
jgi:hypothetical protein